MKAHARDRSSGIQGTTPDKVTSVQSLTCLYGKAELRPYQVWGAAGHFPAGHCRSFRNLAPAVVLMSDLSPGCDHMGEHGPAVPQMWDISLAYKHAYRMPLTYSLELFPIWIQAVLKQSGELRVGLNRVDMCASNADSSV